MTLYAIYIIPDKISELNRIRNELCKKYDAPDVKLYPIHITLTMSMKIENFEAFEKDIKKYVTFLTPRIIKLNDKTDVISYSKEKRLKNWSGIHIKQYKWYNIMKKDLENISKKYTKKFIENTAPPHISIVYGKPLIGLKPIKSPLTEFMFDKLIIVKQNNKNSPIQIFKEIKLKNLVS